MSSDLMDYNSLVVDLLTSDHPAIAFDVTYRVLDSKGLLEGEVRAHKFLLALASPVFRTSFYDSHFEESNKIDARETTLKAFKTMINIIYKHPVDLKSMSTDEVFELVILAKRYELSKLKAKLKKELEARSLTKESVVEVAKTAIKFQQFEEISKAILNKCAKTLNRELDTKESVLKFLATYYGTEEEGIVMKLMSMMNDLQAPPCSNCQETPCKSGTAITSVKQVRAGTVLAPNKDCIGLNAFGIWNLEQRGEAVVKSIDNMRVIVEEGNAALKHSSFWGYDLISHGIPVFCFYCRK